MSGFNLKEKWESLLDNNPELKGMLSENGMLNNAVNKELKNQITFYDNAILYYLLQQYLHSGRNQKKKQDDFQVFIESAEEELQDQGDKSIKSFGNNISPESASFVHALRGHVSDMVKQLILKRAGIDIE